MAMKTCVVVLVKISEVIRQSWKSFVDVAFQFRARLQMWKHSGGPVRSNFFSMDMYFWSTALSTFAAARFDRIYKV